MLTAVGARVVRATKVGIGLAFGGLQAMTNSDAPAATRKPVVLVIASPTGSSFTWSSNCFAEFDASAEWQGYYSIVDGDCPERGEVPEPDL